MARCARKAPAKGLPCSEHKGMLTLMELPGNVRLRARYWRLVGAFEEWEHAKQSDSPELRKTAERLATLAREG